MENKTIVLSVHQLVDFLLRSGDIDNRVFNRSSMQEGTLLHAFYQSKQGENYLSEIPLSYTFSISDLAIKLEGRADGIIKNKDEYIVDEIKTTVDDLSHFRKENLEWHLGQAKCYAYMFAKENNLDHIGVRLTYIRQGDIKDKLIDSYSFDIYSLEQDIYDLLDQYLDFYRILEKLQKERDISISNMEFPFKNYRKGQKELAKYVYSISKNGGRLFVEAPTGIGKTMSTLYPYLKSIEGNDKAKIFYLTAKTSGKENAHKAYSILHEQGLKAKSIVITAKEKICLSKGCGCNPDECPYAKGYYSKISAIIKHTILSYDDIDYSLLIKIAKENEVCPFELELDLSLFVDLIICDYNYLYDPVSYMKRYFDEDSSSYLALVDEAHNLIDRSKDMYSADISYKEFLNARKSIRKIKNPKLKTIFSKMNKMFESINDTYKEEYNVIGNIDESDYKVINAFQEKIKEISKNDNKDINKETLNFYLNVLRFLKIYELVDEHYMIYIHRSVDETKIRLYCLDASYFLNNISRRIKSTVYFSATLSPIDYYINTLGGDNNEDPRLLLQSPFNPKNLSILIAPKVSIKYKNRDNSINDVDKYINTFINGKIGNYLIYLPSYEYLNKFKSIQTLSPDINYFYQEKEMTELDKESFLANFKENPKKRNVGFAIIGGAFSEGIDLVSDRLIGVVIVGIGLPKINYESDQMLSYYNNHDLNGYSYAYLYPGINKVMQAIGRVIRSEEDKGMVLLIDERYTLNMYRSLFKNEWKDYQIVLNEDDIKIATSKFYKN